MMTACCRSIALWVVDRWRSFEPKGKTMTVDFMFGCHESVINAPRNTISLFTADIGKLTFHKLPKCWFEPILKLVTLTELQLQGDFELRVVPEMCQRVMPGIVNHEEVRHLQQ